ncbi:retinol-binding protein pinta-like [Homalodisca vitripennis]|uniref:retinol-binding protein pinta-like n=1 Tax=Homalodisca vitripennis TaxID=197043 RepID=UPI001EECF0EA|nr:retinol-binding protein pinta-like [Homalodisca vitripennis]
MVVMDSGLVLCEDRKASLYKEYMMTPESVQKDIDALKLWILKQPHLPDISQLDLDKWLEGILLLTKNSVERAKHSIDSYFTARTACPSIFYKRNLQDPELKDSFNHVKVALMPGLTEEGHRVLLMKIDSPDPAVFNLEAHMKRCSMIVDFYLQHGVDFTGLHVLHDLEHIGLGHISKFSLQLMKVMAIAMKAYPCRIPKITLVNTPYFVDKVLALFRPFMSPKLMARITSFKDSSQLLNILPAHLVPMDYGGLAPSVDELNGFWRTKMEESADFFALSDSLKTDERKRLGKKNISESEFGPNGSFRQLSVD